MPIALLAPLCDSVYAAGMNPTQKRLQSYLPLIYVSAFGPGLYAWRAEKGLNICMGPYSRKPTLTLTDLARVVAEPIRTAPQTSLDPHNDGRWAAPSGAVLAYVVAIENESLRNTMALFALIQAAYPTRQQHDHYRVVVDLTSRIAKLMQEQSIEDVRTINPDKLTYQVLQGQCGEGLTDFQRATVSRMWFHLRNRFEAYAERLPPEEADRMSPFFVQRITSRFRPATAFSLANYLRKQQDRVKDKVDAVHAHLRTIRFVSTARLNQVRRMWEAAEAAVAKATAGKQVLPFEFSYEETAFTEKGRPIRQRVRLRLWDFVSAYDHSVILGLKPGSATRWKRRRKAGSFSSARNYFQVEYLGTESLDGKTTPIPFWFLEMYEESVFSARKDPEDANRRQAFCRRWGYGTKRPWHVGRGLLSWRVSHNDPWIHLRRHGHGVFLPFDGLRASTLLGHLIVRLQLITGARLGEVQQVAQNRDCIKQLVNVGPKGTTRWLLRMVPKGRRERENYYIDEDTKDYLMDVVRFLRVKGKTKTLPTVALRRTGQSRDRYIFQMGWTRTRSGRHEYTDPILTPRSGVRRRGWETRSY